METFLYRFVSYRNIVSHVMLTITLKNILDHFGPSHLCKLTQLLNNQLG